MAATLGRICRSSLLKTNNLSSINQTYNFSTSRVFTRGEKAIATCLGITAGGLGALVLALENSLKAADGQAHAPKHGWDFNGIFNSLDHASMRRGWEVYKNVCSACHSLRYVAYRHLVNNTHTEAEAKALAEDVLIQDGPNDKGEMFMRPGKLSDYVPSPYPNEEAARAANNGAYPPDLSFILNGRHGGEDYIFSLLTGYCDAPAGVHLMEGQNFNPYFPGGAIGMAQVIYDEVLDYDDGTPATASQIAKDIATFLMWTSNFEHDTRKLYTIKAIGIFALTTTIIWVMKKQKWAGVKSMKIAFMPKKK